MERTFPLTGEPGAVPAARRFVAETLREHATPESLVAAAELVVTELASNALLHARPPVRLRVSADVDGVRLEMSDGSSVAPVRALAGPEAMTGRGLSLVDAVAQRWGVGRVDGGKVVWVELAGSSGVAGDHDRRVEVVRPPARGQARPDDAATATRISVTLGDVPTELLLAAKAHVDNVVREFTLAAAGASAGSTAPLSTDLARLVTTVTTRFAEARRSIKEQAMAAVAAGEERTRLVLELPVSAADAGRDYLAALDDVDAYARADRLLTLESPPEHRAFRRWYVTSLIEQLEASSAGAAVGPPPTFEQFLLGELGAVAAAGRAADRVARLQAATAALASATALEDVAKVVVSEGVAALDAAGGGLILSTDDEHLLVPATVGYPAELVGRLRAEHKDEQLPAAVVLQTGRAVWVESREERDELFPDLSGLEPAAVSMCAVPLKVGGQVLGVLRFSFDRPKLFDEGERQFIESLAAQTALAVDRSQLHMAERVARDSAETAAGRLERLHRVTVALAAASTDDEIAEAVVAESAGTLGAALSALCVLDGETLRIIGLGGARAETRQRWASFPLAADLPASEAVRTMTPVVVADRAAFEARFPSLKGQVPHEGANVSVPVTAAGQPLGSLSLTFPPGHAVDQSEVDLLATIGRQCGVALERARLFTAERAARERAAFLADASGLLSSSLEPAETLRNLTSILVPRLADWAVVYLAEDATRVDLASAAHRDPALTPVMVELQRNNPPDLSQPGGLGDVLRSGRSIHHGVVPDDVRRRATDRIDDAELAAAFSPRSAIVTALKVRGRVLGALALARTGGSSYSVDDVALIEEVSSRAAVAVDNAETFRRERDAAVTLQRSLLPQRLPRIDGVAFAWRYLPGAAGTDIGGDWYDVIPLEHGRVALVIGDVMGRGLRAAALMGQLRATARAHASAELGPAEVLARLDNALARLEQDQITTVAFALLDPATRSLTVATAGHLPPLLEAGGGARYLDVEPGPPLGAGGTGYPELHLTLPEHSMLLLYTDGLVEDRSLSVDVGLETLRRAVEGVTTPEVMCDRALAALGRDTQHDDDTAVLAVSLLPRE